MPWWRVALVALIGTASSLVGLLYLAVPASSSSVAYDALRRLASFDLWGAVWLAGGIAILFALLFWPHHLAVLLGIFGSLLIFWAAMILSAAPKHHGVGAVGAVLYLFMAGVTWLQASAVSGAA